MEILGNLFKFPILMVDGSMEDKKKSLGLPGDEDVELIRGEAECPVNDFVSVCDTFVPTEDSHSKAKEGIFEVCFVRFQTAGNYIVPWNKAKFKKRFTDFVKAIPPELPIIQVTKEQMEEILKKEKENIETKDICRAEDTPNIG